MKKQRSASPSQAMPSSAPVSRDLVDDEAAVLLEQRVRLVVGELAVRLPVGRAPARSGSRRAAGPTIGPAMPLPPSSTTFMRRDLARVDVAERVLAEGVAHVLGRDLARPVRGRTRLARGHDVAQLADARVARERQRAALHELRARVGRRVVGGGAHQPAVELARPDRPVELLGSDHPHVDHVAPSSAMPRRTARPCRGRQPHVAPEPHGAPRPACPGGRRARARSRARCGRRAARPSARGRCPGRRRP